MPLVRQYGTYGILFMTVPEARVIYFLDSEGDICNYLQNNSLTQLFDIDVLNLFNFTFILFYIYNWFPNQLFVYLEFLPQKIIRVISPVMNVAVAKSHILLQHDSSSDNVWSGLLLSGSGRRSYDCKGLNGIVLEPVFYTGVWCKGISIYKIYFSLV